MGLVWASQVALVVKNTPVNVGGVRRRSGRSPRGGNGSPFHYSCLENPMDRGTWQVVVHGVT